MYTKISSVSNILYICGDHLSYDLEGSLKSNSYNITSKVVYTSDAITELSKNEIAQINEVVEIVMLYFRVVYFNQLQNENKNILYTKRA